MRDADAARVPETRKDKSLEMQHRKIWARMVMVVGVLAAALPAAAQDAQEDLKAQLEKQLALNAALEDRIAEIEAMLKKDVCANQAEAEALLNAPDPAAATR